MENIDERSCCNCDDQPLRLKPDQIQIDVEASDWQEAIERTCAPLIVGGFIDKLYVKNVIDRERRWPTGLPVRPIAVAIPHAETGENIKKSAVAVAVLKESVKFHEAGGGVCQVSCRICYFIITLIRCLTDLPFTWSLCLYGSNP